MNYTEIAKFPSSSSDKVYTVKQNENGELSCDCRGWTIKKPGQERSCKHTREVWVTHLGGFPGATAPAPVPDEPTGAEDEPKGSGPEGEIGDLMAGIEEHREGQSGLSLVEKMRQMKAAEGG